MSVARYGRLVIYLSLHAGARYSAASDMIYIRVAGTVSSAGASRALVSLP
jgi:hypothetical protein